MPANPKKIKNDIKKKTGRTSKPKRDTPHKVTEANKALVMSLAEDGLSLDQIRYYIRDSHDLPISLCTLQEHYDDEYRSGVANLTQKVGASMIKVASSGKIHPATVAAGQFVLRSKSGWKEEPAVSKIEVTGEDGKPIDHKHTIDVSKTVGDLFATIAASKTSGSHESDKLAEDSEG